MIKGEGSVVACTKQQGIEHFNSGQGDGELWHPDPLYCVAVEPLS